MDTLNGHEIVQIASHFEGSHYLALSANGVVFSWGANDEAAEHGQLGHNSTRLVTRSIGC